MKRQLGVGIGFGGLLLLMFLAGCGGNDSGLDSSGQNGMDADRNFATVTHNYWKYMTVTGAPTPRSSHNAIWTGTEMLVWGGGANTGGKYDPQADAWTPMATANAPLARGNNSAVWVTYGSTAEMIVWGGASGSTYYNDGGKYDPVSNSWTAISTANAPVARFDHSAVWTGTEMIVLGGITHMSLNCPTYTAEGGRYDPALDSWTPTSTVSAYGKANMAGVWTGAEVVVWGGGLGGVCSGYYNNGGRYNPGLDSWGSVSMTNAPSIRTGFSTVWTGKEMIVWGGYYNDGYTSHYYNNGARYNPSIDH